jgi:hypothetical protein
MSAQAWLQIILTLIAIFLVSIPLGRYMARIVMGRPTKLDRIFDPNDNAVYFLIGRRVTAQAMTWRTYTSHMLATNLVMAIIIYLVLSFQNYLPLNQLNFPAVDPLLAFNTTITSSPIRTGKHMAASRRCRISARWGPSPLRCSHRRLPASSWQWPGSGHLRSAMEALTLATSIVTSSGS